MMPAMFAEALGIKGHNKEGWVAGAYEALKDAEGVEIAFAFPVPREDMVKSGILKGKKEEVRFFAFYEDMNHPEVYDAGLESSLGLICEEYRPDVIHVFGTEFPHAKALIRVEEWKKKAIIHMQGLMEECEKNYLAGLPESVISDNTFRDVIKGDGLKKQKEKYKKRAEMEAFTVQNAFYFCVRTDFDEKFVKERNRSAVCYSLNETLRPCFYEGRWRPEGCTPFSIFVSQGNIPLKGLHFLLKSSKKVAEAYPDVMLRVAGDDVVRGSSVKDRLKLPAYGKYLKELIDENGLSGHVIFTGPLSAEQMKKEYLDANVFVLPSAVENSPNSLGEAMLLGVPSVSCISGGIPSLAEDKKEARLVSFGDEDALADAILDIFDDSVYASLLGENAAARARLTHDRTANAKMLLWIYEDMVKKNA